MDAERHDLIDGPTWELESLMVLSGTGKAMQKREQPISFPHCFCDGQESRLNELQEAGEISAI